MNKHAFLALFSVAVLLLGSALFFNGPSLAAQVVEGPDTALVQPIDRVQTASAVSLEPQPHPILSDIRIRRAIAHCTNKDGLVAAAYPGLTPSEREALISDTFLHPSSWAYSEPAVIYAFNPETGMSLLEDAGWVLPSGGEIRMKDGRELVLTVRTTGSEMRLAFLPVFENQMHTCGIHVIRDHRGNLDWLHFRDFEAAEYAWILDPEEPGGVELFACQSIPSPDNGWNGQNYTGWCNQEASEAITQASDTSLSQEERQAFYATSIDLFAEDVPVLPLFFRDGSTDAWEHMDFNLETYAQDEDLTPEGTGGSPLTYFDYVGNEHAAAAPSGAVTQTVTLQFYPLVVNSKELPDGMVSTNAFRLSALLAGVPQESFLFSEPLTLTVQYDPESIVYHVRENSLALYAWDEGLGDWMDAAETCPPGQRYSWLDTGANLYEVRVCHLSEFSLFGVGGESIRMGVNYGLDEAAGMYEIGHTFTITVTDSGGTPKATATGVTEAGGEDSGTGPDFAWSDGFWVRQGDWSDPALDILPGDWVHFQSDDGFSESIQVGTITASLNPATDSATGSITAPGFDAELEAFAGYWGWFWQDFTVQPDGSEFYVDFAPHDLEPGTQVSVGYREPDLDHVINVFTTPQHEIYLPFALRGNLE